MDRVRSIYCYNCGAEYDFGRQMLFSCPFCEYSLDVAYNYGEIARIIRRQKKTFLHAPISHWKYWMFYPVERAHMVTLGEGSTPLVESVKHKDILFKYEAANPTGSFKDRGSAVEVTRAVELGVKEIACASTGNMGASVAAYCSRAGIKSRVFVPMFTPRAKIAQMKAHGASVVKVRGSYERALGITKKLRWEKHIYLMGDYPTRGEGEKSVGFEIAEQLRWKPPRNVIAPIGNGTHIYALYKAFRELKEVGLTRKVPRIFGVQASRCNPVYRAFEKNLDYVPVVNNPRTIATAVACGNPVDGLEALNAVRKSHGEITQATEKEIMEARHELAKEGLFAEPSGALAYAGFKKMKPDGKTVCVITGHGLKEPFV